MLREAFTLANMLLDLGFASDCPVGRALFATGSSDRTLGASSERGDSTEVAIVLTDGGDAILFEIDATFIPLAGTGLAGLP